MGSPEYSSVTPKSFSVIFTIADIICMVIQGIGGGQTGGSDDTDGLKKGLQIMAIGVIAQSEHDSGCSCTHYPSATP